MKKNALAVSAMLLCMVLVLTACSTTPAESQTPSSPGQTQATLPVEPTAPVQSNEPDIEPCEWSWDAELYWDNPETFAYQIAIYPTDEIPSKLPSVKVISVETGRRVLDVYGVNAIARDNTGNKTGVTYIIIVNKAGKSIDDFRFVLEHEKANHEKTEHDITLGGGNEHFLDKLDMASTNGFELNGILLANPYDGTKSFQSDRFTYNLVYQVLTPGTQTSDIQFPIDDIVFVNSETREIESIPGSGELVSIESTPIERVSPENRPGVDFLFTFTADEDELRAVSEWFDTITIGYRAQSGNIILLPKPLGP